MGSARLRSQAAMEYLTTYGWAVILITIALAALITIGVFNGNASAGTGCVPVGSYVCRNMVLNGLGNLSFSVLESVGPTIYNMAFACTATSTSSGVPNPPSAMVYVDGSGAATTGHPSTTAGGALSMGIQQQVSVSLLKCFDNNGDALKNQPVGAPFTGYIWMNYTSGPGAPTGPTGTNPFLTVKLAIITAKAA